MSALARIFHEIRGWNSNCPVAHRFVDDFQHSRKIQFVRYRFLGQGDHPWIFLRKRKSTLQDRPMGPKSDGESRPIPLSHSYDYAFRAIEPGFTRQLDREFRYPAKYAG